MTEEKKTIPDEKKEDDVPVPHQFVELNQNEWAFKDFFDEKDSYLHYN
jgi:hypothetical protein